MMIYKALIIKVVVILTNFVKPAIFTLHSSVTTTGG